MCAPGVAAYTFKSIRSHPKPVRTPTPSGIRSAISRLARISSRRFIFSVSRRAKTVSHPVKTFPLPDKTATAVLRTQPPTARDPAATHPLQLRSHMPGRREKLQE